VRELYTETEIYAPETLVWRVVTEFHRYPEWNPLFPKGVDGIAEVGCTLVAPQERAHGRLVVLTPVVEVADGCELRWRDRALLPWLFSGERRFELHPVAPALVRFVQAERFHGVLVPLVRRAFYDRLLEKFRAMNEALKIEAERRFAAEAGFVRNAVRVAA
jgi:hypothetical protein